MAQGCGAFSGYYGGEDADAAVLQVGLCGLVAGDDPRLAATVQDVEKTLLGGGTVYRYRGDDGLPGSEGGFNLCTSWLIRCYLLVGRVEDARAFQEVHGVRGQDRSDPRGVRPGDRARPGKPPSGVLTPRFDPVRTGDRQGGVRGVVNTGGGTRTPKTFRPADFESAASASSATPAREHAWRGDDREWERPPDGSGGNAPGRNVQWGGRRICGTPDV